MPSALLVAHGQPADPHPQEETLISLAARVADLLPDWQIRGATLAAQGALEAALKDSPPDTFVYPFFMAEGWFTGKELPRRLKALQADKVRQLAPFGTDPNLPKLIAEVTLQAAEDAGYAPRNTTLLLAAHGSKVSRASANTTYAMAEIMRARTPFAKVTTGFVEEAPFLANAAKDLGQAICLPFFALRAGHVSGDLPEALAEARFTGPLLPAIGEHPQTATLIAEALRRAL